MDIALVRFGLLHEGLGAGFGDGAEIVDELGLAHADAIIGDRQGLGRLVGGDGDGEIGIAGNEVGLGDRLIAQFVERIGGIGDELAQEDVAVGIDRMHHEMQELGDFRLEIMGVRFACLRRFRLSLRHLQTLLSDWSGIWGKPLSPSRCQWRRVRPKKKRPVFTGREL